MNSYLELSDVGIEFPTDNGPFCALKGVNIKIDEGDFVSIIGHSGCGKSCLLYTSPSPRDLSTSRMPSSA